MKITIKTKDGTEIEYIDGNSTITIYDIIQLIQQLQDGKGTTDK